MFCNMDATLTQSCKAVTIMEENQQVPDLKALCDFGTKVRLKKVPNPHKGIIGEKKPKTKRTISHSPNFTLLASYQIKKKLRTN